MRLVYISGLAIMETPDWVITWASIQVIIFDTFAIGAQDVIQFWASYHGVEVSIHAEVDAFKPPPSKQILTPHLGKDQIVSTAPTN